MDEKNVGYSEIDNMIEYIRSIDWLNEPYLCGVLISHVILAVAIWIYRARFVVLCGIFAALLTTIAASSYINEYLALNSKLLFKEQYFDSNGLFICIIWNFPAILNTIFIIMLWFRYTFDLMVKVRLMKMKSEARKKKE